MEIANKNLLRPVAEGTKKYAVKDKKYTITAIPITMSKFGPSGSLKNENIALEHATDVIPKISNEAFFELSIFVIILENSLAALYDQVRTYFEREN